MGEEQKRVRQKNKRGYIEKWEQTDSPAIPDRGETSDIPSLPSGAKLGTKPTSCGQILMCNRYTIHNDQSTAKIISGQQ